jgi:hypothetical protein
MRNNVAMPICEQEDWRALGKVGRLFAALHADVDCLSKMDFTLGLHPYPGFLQGGFYDR